MLIKVALFACCVALSAAIPIIFKPSAFLKHSSIEHGYPTSWQSIRFFDMPNTNLKKQGANYMYPHYEFEYAVSDKKHGDHKRHYEHRNGDKVHGEYSLLEPGGSLRRVQYNADDENGFNAVVYHHANGHGAQGHSCTENTGYYHQPNHNPDTKHHHEHKEKPVNEKSEDTSETDNSIENRKDNATPKENMEKELLSNHKPKVSFSSLMLVGPPIKTHSSLQTNMENDQTHGTEEIALGDERKPLENPVATKAETMPMNRGANSMEGSKDSEVASSRYRPAHAYDVHRIPSLKNIVIKF